MANRKINESELSADQKMALSLMLSGKNVFCAGSAGTGKSSLIHLFKEKYQGNCVVVAPTGIAAINIEGQTIHSFFMLPPGLLVPDNLEMIPWPRKREVLRQVNCIIIDEISMVRSDMFAAIDLRMRQCSKGSAKRMPFGGKQVIVCGDFFQLPPVVADDVEDDWLQANLGGEYAFQTPVWKEAQFKTALLKTPFRQKDDLRFLDMLDSIRHGDLASKKTIVDGEELDAVEALNRLCTSDKIMPRVPIRLCTTNREAHAVNSAARAQIDSPPVTFQAQIRGKFNEADYPTEAELVLKKGCRVMVLKNAHKPKGSGFFYVNGDCGTVVDIKEDHEASRVRVLFDNGTDAWVSCAEWKNTKYVMETDRFTGKKIIRQDEIGCFTQIPLRLAYATTIHKSQGMSLDYVDVKLGNGCFAHGQLYTALSRARSLAGLHLERKISVDDLILDDRIVDFYKSIDPASRLQSNPSKKQLEVPEEHYEKLKAMLEKLEKGEDNSVDAEVL